MQAMKTTTLAVRVDPALRDALATTAALHGRSTAQEVRVALACWIDASATALCDETREPGRVEAR